MAEKTAQQPTAPPVTSAFTSNAGQAAFGDFSSTVMYHSSAREGAKLHIQQLFQEQNTLGRQVQESTARLLGVNQQLADSVVFSQWVGNTHHDVNAPHELERTQEALDSAEIEIKALKAEVSSLEAQKNELQRQLHHAVPVAPGSTVTDRSVLTQLQEELSKAKRLVRTKETLVSAMTNEMDSLREQLSEKRLEIERLSEQCQQLSAPLASSLQSPLAARLCYTSSATENEEWASGHKTEVTDTGNAAASENAELTEKDLRALLKKKERQLAEVIKINQDWERQYKRLSREHEALKTAQEAKSEAREDNRSRSHSKRRSRHHHHRGDSALAELQSVLEASQIELAAARERSKLLEKKLHEKQRSLIDETEQHQLLLAEKESLEAHMQSTSKGEETVQQIQLQLENVRRELQTSMNSELRMRRELLTSQTQVNQLRQQLTEAAAASDDSKADQAEVLDLQSQLEACRDRIAALKTQAEMNADDFRREQQDKQLIERQLSTFRDQLQHLLQGPILPFQDNSHPSGQGSSIHFSGEHAEIDNQTVPEAHLGPAAGLGMKCPECNKEFKQRGELLDHMLSCPRRDS